MGVQTRNLAIVSTKYFQFLMYQIEEIHSLSKMFDCPSKVQMVENNLLRIEILSEDLRRKMGNFSEGYS